MRSTVIIAGALLGAGCFRSPAPYDGPAPEGVDASPYVGCYEVRHLKPDEMLINKQWKLRLDSALSQSTTPGTRRAPGVRQATTSRSGDVAVEWWLIPGGIQLHAGNSLHGQYIEFYP